MVFPCKLLMNFFFVNFWIQGADCGRNGYLAKVTSSSMGGTSCGNGIKHHSRSRVLESSDYISDRIWVGSWPNRCCGKRVQPRCRAAITIVCYSGPGTFGLWMGPWERPLQHSFNVGRIDIIQEFSVEWRYPLSTSSTYSKQVTNANLTILFIHMLKSKMISYF